MEQYRDTQLFRHLVCDERLVEQQCWRVSVRLFRTILLLITALIYGCGGSTNEIATNDPEDTTLINGLTPVESQPLDCEQEAYPCRLSDVLPAVRTKSQSYAQSAINIMANGSITAAVAWLQEQPDIVSISSDERSIVFRLENGRPHWVLSQLAYSNVPDVEAFSDSNQPAQSISTNTEKPARLIEPMSRHIVGDNPTEKSALFISPYAWQFRLNDDAPIVQQILGSTRGYTGRIDTYSNDLNNSIIALDAYDNWNDYDVVHVSSHGMQQCENNQCQTLLLAGRRYDDPTNQAEFSNKVGVVEVSSGPKTQIGITNEWGLSDDFFKLKNKDGLDKTMVFFSACETMKEDEFSNIFKKPGGVFLGWNGRVATTAALSASRRFYKALSDTGRRSKNVYDVLIREGLTYDASSDSTLVWNQGNKDLRIREVVTAFSPTNDLPTKSEPLQAGDQLIIEGKFGDGSADKMPFTVQIDGVEEDELNEFVLHISVDGKEATETWTLDNAVPVNPPWEPDNYSYQIHDVAEFSFDFQPGELLDVRFWVELPEGGESEFEILLTTSAWSMQFAGAHLTDTYFGNGAIIGGPFDSTQLLLTTNAFSVDSNLPNNETRDLLVNISVLLDEPYSEGASFAVDNLRISFVSVTPDNPNGITELIVAGGKDYEVETLVLAQPTQLLELPPIGSFTPPPPSNITFTEVDNQLGLVSGKVDGSVYACARGNGTIANVYSEPVDMEYCDTYTVSISFNVQ